MDYLQPYKEIFDRYLTDHRFDKSPINLYKPVNYILSLGGKRIRPLLLILVSEAVGGRMDKALDAAFAIELFHNFTLLHDDIMDNAPLRRGFPTVHEKYDVNTAILSGDAMMILSYHFLGKYEDSTELISIFSNMALEVCEGQQMDMDFEERSDVMIPEYIEMIKLKTSVLIGAALQMGAIIGGADRKVSEHLYNYGVNIGIAFQIQDDLLDTYGTPKVGKQACGDIIQNKKTYLYLKSLELASESEKKELNQLFSTSPEDPSSKVKKVLDIFNSANVKGYSEELKLVYKDLAHSHLTAANLIRDQRLKFESFSDYLLQRNV